MAPEDVNEVAVLGWNRIGSLVGWAKKAIQMRLSPVESVLLAACVVRAVVVVYWGIKILAA